MGALLPVPDLPGQPSPAGGGGEGEVRFTSHSAWPGSRRLLFKQGSLKFPILFDFQSGSLLLDPTSKWRLWKGDSIDC